MPADPGSDGGGIQPSALVETAVLVMARRRVVFGLGVTQQHQTAHGRDLDSVLVWINLQAHARDKVTSAATVRKKTTWLRLSQVRATAPTTTRLCSRLSFDLDVDICVVGRPCRPRWRWRPRARRQRRRARRPACRLERVRPSLGTVMPGYSLPIGELIERVGLDDAANWALSKEAPIMSRRRHRRGDAGIALTEAR
jgi:hypothetical protein